MAEQKECLVFLFLLCHVRKNMTTDYKNLKSTEVLAVAMIAVGVALIGFQIFLALPEQSQSQVVASFQVLEISDAIAEAWQVEVKANDLVFNGVEDFYDEFYVAFMDMVVEPIAHHLEQTAYAYNSFYEGVVTVSEQFAGNYGYSQPGVEADRGGKVLGEYFETLEPQLVGAKIAQ